MVDGLHFRSDAEVAVYGALKTCDAALPQTERLTIAPNAGLRVGDHTWEVDFLVTYMGHAGVVEVDGHHHKKRWANDRLRDEVLREAGVAYVYRIPVEETSDEETLGAHVERFLSRLVGQ